MSANILRCLTRHASSKQLLKFTVVSNKSSSRKNSNIVHSLLPNVDIPNVSVPDYLFQNFSKFPNKIAVECVATGKKFTYEELRTKSKNLNRALRKKLKLQKGDVVAVLLPNVPEYPICILGPLQASLTVTTINPLYTPVLWI
ncbi:hypothetical protein ILUMI_17146 [Ignelater luminosus]|uniref:AMP-dependent synthetase/ligase domain-containing protein n=1 Tax=Ignelater luminosus TaxID=2038154 RepID=A0A8K0CRJ9_IGNLU|nr:hypothetical protein ILUMI_17146 [Ignelater luminosus]